MRQAAKNRWFSVQSHLFFIPFFTHKELCELLMKSASRQNAEAQKFVQQKTTLAAAGQRLYNQTKNRKEGFQVNIKIIQRQCGGTEFIHPPAEVLNRLISLAASNGIRRLDRSEDFS